MTQPENSPMAPDDCEHAWVTHVRGGEPLAVRICSLCQAIDWDDLRAQMGAIDAEARATWVAWLRAQLDEDERIARELHARTCGHADVDPGAACNCDWHIARVLREVEVKRKVIELYEYAAGAWALDRDKPNPPTVHLGEKTIAEAILREIELLYAARPGYREQWRPAP